MPCGATAGILSSSVSLPRGRVCRVGRVRRRAARKTPNGDSPATVDKDYAMALAPTTGSVALRLLVNPDAGPFPRLRITAGGGDRGLEGVLGKDLTAGTNKTIRATTYRTPWPTTNYGSGVAPVCTLFSAGVCASAVTVQTQCSVPWVPSPASSGYNPVHTSVVTRQQPRMHQVGAY